MKGSTTTISCVITGSKKPVTVSWRTATEAVSGSKFNTAQGSHSGVTQTSTLTVESTEVTEDKAYTCRVTSGSFPDSGHFDNTVNLNVFGKFCTIIGISCCKEAGKACICYPPVGQQAQPLFIDRCCKEKQLL